MTQVTTHFKARKAPKVKKPKAASKRPGMSESHLADIRSLPSVVSGKRPCQAHHLRCAGGRGTGQKAEDKWALPLTAGEHVLDADCVHRVGSKKEFEWFMSRGINPIELASALWANRGDRGQMERVVAAHRGRE